MANKTERRRAISKEDKSRKETEKERMVHSVKLLGVYKAPLIYSRIAFAIYDASNEGLNWINPPVRHEVQSYWNSFDTIWISH